MKESDRNLVRSMAEKDRIKVVAYEIRLEQDRYAKCEELGGHIWFETGWYETSWYGRASGTHPKKPKLVRHCKVCYFEDIKDVPEEVCKDD